MRVFESSHPRLQRAVGHNIIIVLGPSFTFGGGVYGGLEALAAAYQNIAEGRIESAIVGGSSSIVDPKLSVSFLRLGFLSPDGLTRSFDANCKFKGIFCYVVISLKYVYYSYSCSYWLWTQRRRCCLIFTASARRKKKLRNHTNIRKFLLRYEPVYIYRFQ